MLPDLRIRAVDEEVRSEMERDALMAKVRSKLDQHSGNMTKDPLNPE